MSVSSEFLDFLIESLAPLGAVQARRMFGGAGLYLDGVMFALIADDAVYLKADDKTCGAFEEEGLKPFTYQGKAKPVTMSYWRAPERVFDDPDEFVAWATTAIGVANASANKKKQRSGRVAKAKPKKSTKRKAQRTGLRKTK